MCTAVKPMNAAAIFIAAMSFSIAPRVSNYSTGVVDGVSMKAGRESVGVSGDLRVNKLVFDYTYDHDPNANITIVDLLMDGGDFTRNHSEVTAGYAIAPLLDLQAGLRAESFHVTRMPIPADMNFTDHALVYGVKLHATSFYGVARGYSGRANVNSVHEMPARGFQIESGYAIPFGKSPWSFTPAYQYERINIRGSRIRFDTNRFMLQFVYRR